MVFLVALFFTHIKKLDQTPGLTYATNTLTDPGQDPAPNPRAGHKPQTRKAQDTQDTHRDPLQIQGKTKTPDQIRNQKPNKKGKTQKHKTIKPY